MGERRLLALVRGHRMKALLERMLDPEEFLSDFGVRSLSRYHRDHPYELNLAGQTWQVAYEPAESRTALFGGNSNWRGPIWFPINFLLIEALQRFHHYYGDDFRVECPVGSGRMLALDQVAAELSRRLQSIFLPGPDGRRPFQGTDPLATAGQVTAANNTACTCTLPRPIAVVAYDEGQDNSVVPYNGAQTPNLRTDCPPNSSCVGIGFTSAVVNFQTWARFDSCTGSASTDPNNSLCQTYASCSAGTQVTLCTVPEANHLGAYSNANAKVADTAWNVFRNQSLP